MKVLAEGDLVLLTSRDRKQFLVRLERGGVLQTHRGRVAHEELIGRSPGGEVRSHLDYPFAALQPSLADLVAKLKRTTQIMYPKDIAYVLLKLNVAPGDRVIEAGTGSGGLSLALSRTVGASGRLYSYEARPDILRLAQSNVEAVGLAAHVEFKLRDIADGFDETDVDAVFLDLRYPWRFLSSVVAALKAGGFLGAIVPTTNQAVRLVQGLEMERSFAHIEVEEVLVRPYKAVPARFRPLDRMVAHTGYLVFARKVNPEVSGADYWQDRRRRKHERLLASMEDDDDVDLGEGGLG